MAITPSNVTPVANPIVPMAAKVKPSNCANCSGGTGSRSVTGLSRGWINVRKIVPYGARCGPNSAPIANTTAWSPRITAAAAGETADTASVMMRTVVVTQAEKRGPRTST
ncbi:Uncharacterised protein [Mycobacteroides abscessus subsp. abscessus]|nr:Uncharacterised protein [Mycobacteroides abscessus subsp. abscessus]